MRRPAPATRIVVRDDDPWPCDALELGQVVRGPDGRDVEVAALSGRRLPDGRWVHRVLLRDVGDCRTTGP